MEKRKNCPGCFASVDKAKAEVQSNPPAEKLTLDQQGKFLSGYNAQRVFFTYARCPSCDLLYCPTYFTQEQLNHLYKSQSENMAEAPLAARASTQKAYCRLLNRFHTPQGNYLEIGADIGLFAKYFSENAGVGQLYLYEPNQEVHATLQKNLAHKKYELRTHPYAAVDLEADSLSTAVIIHALDHLLDPRQFLRDLRLNLKPGGVVFIVTHDESSLLAKVLGKKWPPYTLQHPQLFQPTTIQALLTAEGFNILSSHKTVNYFPLTHFIKGGLTALGFTKQFFPNFSKPLLPIRLGNIATLAQKPLEDQA